MSSVTVSGRTELLMGGADSATWVRRIHNEIGRVLLAAIRTRPVRARFAA
jgi:hypothetical protein